MAHFDPQYPSSVSDPNVRLADIHVSSPVPMPDDPKYTNQFASVTNVDLTADPQTPVRFTYKLSLDPKYNKDFPDYVGYVYMGIIDTNVATVIYLYHHALNSMYNSFFKKTLYADINEIDTNYDCKTAKAVSDVLKFLNMALYLIGQGDKRLDVQDFEPLSARDFSMVLQFSPILNNLAEQRVIELGSDPNYLIHTQGYSDYIIDISDPNLGHFVQLEAPYGCSGASYHGTNDVATNNNQLIETPNPSPYSKYVYGGVIVGGLAAVIGGIFLVAKGLRK